MVTNALNDPTGSAAQCAQKITLNLVLGEGQIVQKVNRTNGKLEQPELKKIGEAGRCLLELNLPGGTGDLLCIRKS